MVDIKEKRLFIFVASVLIPLLIGAGSIIYATKSYKEPLKTIGLLTSVAWGWKIFLYLAKYLPLVFAEYPPFSFFKQKEDWTNKYGGWAIVTGE